MQTKEAAMSAVAFYFGIFAAYSWVPVLVYKRELRIFLLKILSTKCLGSGTEKLLGSCYLTYFLKKKKITLSAQHSCLFKHLCFIMKVVKKSYDKKIGKQRNGEQWKSSSLCLL